MSKCKICSLKQDEHDKELWKFHQLNEVCIWCGKKSWKHSLELWEIHQSVISKHEKTATIQPGFGPKTLAKLVKWNTVDGSPYHIERVPIHIRCDGCGSSMSNTETDLADVLSSLCLRCFCEQTDQEYTWHSKPWWQVNGGKYNGGSLNH